MPQTESSHNMYEDTVQCFFYLDTELSKAEWEKLCKSINETINTLSKDYIWHRDEFRVVVPILKENTNDIPCHLTSTTCFGDNIEDEWFIVYIILELTKVYQGLIVQIEDNDGDFLLIEAADCLPAWCNPESTENRVFIYNQHLHLIPLSVASTVATVKLIEAINVIKDKPEETKASQEIEQMILKRIGSYPQKLNDHCHKAILKLPTEIAAILALKPSLISAIVNMYCNLDVLDAKHCKNIKFEDSIDAEVTFTKYLYAMLMQSKFLNYVNCSHISEKEKKKQLGLKVTYAYSIIMSKQSNDICCAPEYKKFLDSLRKNGYFKDNLEGSLQYSQLLENAKAYFFDMECSVSLYACNIINELQASDKYINTLELLKQKSEKGCLEEDNDNWLNVNPEQLNEFLNSHYGEKVKLKNNDPITPHILASELTDFFRDTSDFEGIEQQTRNQEDSIDFNSEDFVDSIEKMLSLVNNAQSDYSSDDDNESNICLKVKAQDLEIASKLGLEDKNVVEVNVLKNLSQSMKEEGITGPVSIMLKQIGIKKKDILDSDDDDV